MPVNTSDWLACILALMASTPDLSECTLDWLENSCEQQANDPVTMECSEETMARIPETLGCTPDSLA